MPEPPFDLVIRGEILDPAARTHMGGEIAVRDGRIAAVGANLSQQPHRPLLDYAGCVISPGFVDLHAHVYHGVTSWGVEPDGPCLKGGVTTVVDAGSPGWTMLQGFRKLIHERATVRALCFLHISGVGLVNAWVNESEDIRHLHPQTVGEHVAENRDLVVGVKVRQGRQQVGDNGTEPLRRAVEAAEIAGTPLMCHIAAGVALNDVLTLMRPGDIITHCYQGRGNERENITDPNGKLLPEAVQARERGIVMDVGHGGGSFRWGIAEAALAEGFLPDVISTDLHAYNLHGPMFDMAVTLTKFLYLGMALEDVIACATVNPARAIGRPELGTLKVGAPADLAVFRIVDEPVELWDTHLERRPWDRRLKVEATVVGGQVYLPDEIDVESEEVITRRCRLRGPEGLATAWKTLRAQRGE
jgi:dihydroorotase